MKIARLFYLLLLAYCWNPLLAAELHSGTATLTVKDRVITIHQHHRPVIELKSIRFNFTEANNWTVISSNNNELVLGAEFPAHVDFYKHVQDNEPRKATLVISKVEGGFRFLSNPSWAKQTTLIFNHLGDHFFGLSEPLQPDNRLSPDLIASSVFVEINAEPALLRENFASAFSAFYMSTFGYGAFFDSFARGRYDFAINGNNQIHHETGNLDWYVFFGENGAQIHESYFALIGQPKPVPAWGLGPIGWRDQNNGGAAEIIADIQNMNDRQIPFTAWFVDRPYSDGAHAWSEMNFNDAFSDPEKWIGKIRNEYGLEFMTWTSTATFGDTRFEKHLGGKLSYLDLSHQETVRAYQGELQSKQYVYGVKGHKVDRADEYFPNYEPWHDEAIDPAQRRNLYSYLMAKIHDEALRKTWGNDQLTFARSAIHRVQPYLSAIWAGDPRTSWQGLQANFANAARSAFMGFPVWGTDVGGYQGEGYIPEDLYIRWMQAGSMSGLFEIKLDGAGGDGRDRMPWQYDDGFQRIFREICEDRMQMLPYLYSLSRTSGRSGTLMQPLAYRHLEDQRTYNTWDQFYLGDAILVAPVFSPDLQRSIYLPAGKWRDYDQPDRRFEGGQSMVMDVPLEKLPRFVKENSIFVTGNIYAGNDRDWNKADKQLTIHAFPGSGSSSSRFEYIDMLNGDATKVIKLDRKEQVLHLTSPAMTHRVNLEITLDQPPLQVRNSGRKVAIEYDEQSGVLYLITKPGEPIDVTVDLGLR